MRVPKTEQPGSEEGQQLTALLPQTNTMDSDGDFSDELLELAGASGAPDKKRKKRHSHSSKSSKRRKAE